MKEFDIVIIGAGVAGMTAAIYGLRAKKSVLLIEKITTGGQILKTQQIENYPGFNSISGNELAGSLRKQVENLGGKIMIAEVLAVKKPDETFVIETDDEPIRAKAVIVANGSKERELGLANEADFVSKGVSYCATCDGALYKDKLAAVYGGGNTAVYSVLYLSGICKKVFWLYRGDELKVEEQLLEKAKAAENVEILPNSEVAELMGDDRLNGIKLENGQEIMLDALFVASGRVADNDRFKELVKLDDMGYIVADESCQTETPGLFAAGDTRAKKLHQIVTATADGAVAASAAVEFLNKKA